MARYFGTNGVRGRFDELAPDLTLRLSQAIGGYFRKGREQGCRVLVARDCRLTGEVLRSSVMAGLASVGCDAIDLGVASSPTAEFMVKKLNADGLIIITASHNPPEWNALKVVDGRGIAISRERGEEIERGLGRTPLAAWDRVGTMTGFATATDEHMLAIKSLLDLGKIKKKKLVLDCGNGTACLMAPKLFTELGMEVVAINAEPDGRFPGRPSEPTEANVKQLIETVKANGADAGVAWDGDGDRVIFVDDRGRYVIGDRVFALCAMWKLANLKGASGAIGDLVTTVATSRVIEDVAARYGVKVRYTAIGAPYLSEEMANGGTKPAIGGEEVGGVIFPELSLAKDGFMAAARMVEAIAEKPLSTWLDELPAYFNVKLKIEADYVRKKQIVSRVAAYAKRNRFDYVGIDGVRVNFKDGWVIVRASGTENYVRIFAEAKTAEQAKTLADEYAGIARGAR